jgi:hypothetical protein
MDHIESRRLLELAQMSEIINQPEWAHIKNCSDCGKAFIVLSGAFEGTRANAGTIRITDPTS